MVPISTKKIKGKERNLTTFIKLKSPLKGCSRGSKHLEVVRAELELLQNFFTVCISSFLKFLPLLLVFIFFKITMILTIRMDLRGAIYILERLGSGAPRLSHDFSNFPH